MRSQFERLYKLVKRHREFSPYFALFDRETFDTLEQENWKKAIGFAQQMIVTRAIAGHPDSE